MVFITWADTILELTVTTEVSVDEISEVVQHPMQFGSDVADHIINKNKRYRFRGMVSNIKSFIIKFTDPSGGNNASGSLKPNQKSVVEYFKDLDALRNSKSLVTFNFDPQVDKGGIINCVITKINYTRQPSHGDAYLVDIELEQVRVQESVSVYEKRSLKNVALNAAKENAGKNTTVSGNTSQSNRLTTTTGVDILLGGAEVVTNNDKLSDSILDRVRKSGGG